MNILFIFSEPLTIGGHFKSAQALAKALHVQGHQVFAFLQGGDERLQAEFENVQVSVCRLKPGLADRLPDGKLRTLCRMFSLVHQLIRVIKKYRIDILHCQDPGFIRFAYLAGSLTRKGLVCTQAGGEFTNHLIPASSPLVVYSAELSDAYQKLQVPFRPETVIYLRERIDMDIYQPGGKNPAMLQEYKIASDAMVFVMAIRLSAQKKPWIDAVFQLMEQLKMPVPVCLLIAGSGTLYDEVCARAERFNGVHEGIRILPLGGVADTRTMRELILLADVVVGNGRGLMEAMACGRAALIAGERGELELITEENIEEAAYWNFSGRHFRKRAESDRSCGIANPGFEDMSRISAFGQQYVRRHYDARNGASKLIQIYRQQTCCRFPAYVGWELFRLKNRPVLKGTRQHAGCR